MSETENNADKGSTMKFMLPIILVIVAVAVIGYVATMKSGIDKHLVEAGLNDMIQYTKQADPSYELAYGKVEMEGSGADRHAVIHDFTWMRKIQSPMTVTIPKVELYSQSVTLDHFRAKAVGSIEVFEDLDEGKTTHFTFDPPLEVDVKAKQSDGLTQWHYEADVPPNLKIGMVEDERNVIVEFGDASAFAGFVELARKSGKLAFDVTSLKAFVEDQADQQMRIDSVVLNSNWSDVKLEQSAISIDFAMNQLFTDDETMPYGPITINVEGDYSGPIPSEDQQIDWSSEKALFALRELSVSADDVALSANLHFQTGRGELLPVGEGALSIENFAFVLAELRAKELLKSEQEELLKVLAKQITGQDLDAIADLSVPVKRADGGSLSIGESNLEELFAIVLTGGKLNPAVADEPAAQQPADAGAKRGASALDVDEVKELFDEQ